MLETGLGRAANAALAALDGFNLTGDMSASRRFYARDIVTEPIDVVDGHVACPWVWAAELDRAFLDASRLLESRSTGTFGAHATRVPVRGVDDRGSPPSRSATPIRLPR